MARGATQKRRNGEKPDAASRARGRVAEQPQPPRIEDTLFFQRIRRQAKWMFVFLALVFGVGFVAFGVGSNAGGSGLGDILNRNGSGGVSESDAREKIREEPRNPQGYRDLAAALRSDNRSVEAIEPLKELTRLRPRDVEASRELAAAYTDEADRLQQEAYLVQYEGQQQAGPVGSILPGFQVGGQVVGQDQISQSLSTQANERLQRAFSLVTPAYATAQSEYERLADLAPSDASIQLQLAAAAAGASDNAAAIGAYRRFIRLAPDDPLVREVRQRIQGLQAQAAVSRQPGSG